MTQTVAVILAASILLGIVGQLFLKAGVSSFGTVAFNASLLRLLLSPKVLAGIAAYVVSSLLWLYVLSRMPLSIAYPTLAVGYILIEILSFFLFQEPLTAHKVAGAVVIALGIWLLYR
ncbi:MAG: hypothetical protein IMW91_07560 [Firmicutes bacterium]|nr:hypothetical protein [Bacillota bacterium]